jgi:fibulin 1/2
MQDIDECSLIPKICPDQCRNTPGSYECYCQNGFILDIKGKLCEGKVLHSNLIKNRKAYNILIADVDECSARTHTCGQRDQCVNTRGSFRCIKLECPDGYRLIEDAKKYIY